MNRHQRRVETKRIRPAKGEDVREHAVKLRQQGRAAEAILHVEKAVSQNPGDADLRNELGILLREQGRLADAEKCFRAVIALAPGHAGAYNNLGNALRQQGLLAEAIEWYRRSNALAPDRPATLSNLGATLQQEGRLDEAIACYRTALTLAPEFAAAHHHLAMALLAQGDFAAGLPEFEWRTRTRQAEQAQHRFVQRQWRGEPACGQTLLIHAEQGFGDTLQFCRFVPLAAARGLDVKLRVQRGLVRLLATSFPEMSVAGSEHPLPPFDLHCPMLSLPLAFGTTLETIPVGVYLRTDREVAASWRTRLGQAGAGLLVGLCWAGNAGALSDVDQRRSIPPGLLSPLFDVPGVAFVSLQKDASMQHGPDRLLDFMEEMADFADTAALIAGLDLVISVDTAVAHLAAGLGRKVWLLDRFAPCWRWLTGRRDSPWYPTLTIYRQSEPGAWGPVVDDVANDLRRLAFALAH